MKKSVIIILVILVALSVVFLKCRGGKTITVYDFKQKITYEMPAKDLTPNMVQVRIEGSEEVFWADANQLKQGEIKHPPFEGELKEKIKMIQDYLFEVYPHDYIFWEDGFRRDQHPEKEIGLWLDMAKVYKDVTGNETDLERKEDIFRLLLCCMSSDRKNILNVTELNVLTPEEAEGVIDKYYQQ